MNSIKHLYVQKVLSLNVVLEIIVLANLYETIFHDYYLLIHPSLFRAQST